ncbi:MAG: cyclopropane-fatty-acyl-phospholipid synthase family protein [Acidimicrobiia bacterium]|nr:cyclopropane-fatty-acyl-phospholipid synthase family protein [Acidimicrobiia bacterium]
MDGEVVDTFAADRLVSVMDHLDVSRRVYELLVRMGGHPAPAIRAWTGEVWGPADAAATIVLNKPGGLRSMLLPPNDLSAAEAYIYEDVDFEGDLYQLLRFAAELSEGKRSVVATARLLRLLRQLPEDSNRTQADQPQFTGLRHSKRRDRAAVTHHYDTGNNFFSQFLDPQLVYSSAAFLSPTDSLETAQQRKLDLICRKLRLSPGMRLLDVGCGWGSLVIHAARDYGVKATGITLSEEQAIEARRRVDAARLTDQVHIEVRDYRDLRGEFDAISSVGMVEHVGRKELGNYFSILRESLAPGGQLLNHGIVTRDRKRGRIKPTFVNTYVFPDGELANVDEVVAAAEESGFELRDAESLRASYALTLQAWVTNLEASRVEAVAATSEQTYRIWRLYMAGSAVAFDRAAISVYQLLLSDPTRPWTYGRHHLLASDDG